VTLGHCPVIVVCWVDQYWRSDRALSPDLDLVITAFPPHNPNLMALPITMKIRQAYNIVLVLGG
jgi:hypothetical protein